MPEWTTDVLARVASGQTTKDDLRKLGASSAGDPILDYNDFMFTHMRMHAAHASYPMGMSFPIDSKYGTAMNHFIARMSHDISKDLYDQLQVEGVKGALVEFGVFNGDWLATMLDHMEAKRNVSETYGFDSFEGLPAPDPSNDGPFWQKGQYAADLASVGGRLKQDQRPYLKLIKGWFSDTLKREENTIGDIAFAKIDCDLYGPAVECLDYLASRLSNGAILFFDDWNHVSNAGETKAFLEWAPRFPEFRFELFGFVGHKMFMRVWR